MIREHSGKDHVFVAVDEFTRVTDPSHTPEKQQAILKDFANTFTSELDNIVGEKRVNFVFTSLASIPLGKIEIASGRRCQVGLSLRLKHWEY
jgi:hypothetical protein